jgi:hypothetical protein
MDCFNSNQLRSGSGRTQHACAFPSRAVERQTDDRYVQRSPNRFGKAKFTVRKETGSELLRNPANNTYNREAPASVREGRKRSREHDENDGTDCEYERNNITVTISVPYSKVKETYQATNSIGMKHNKSLARTRTSLAVNYPIYPTDLVLHVLNILHQL